VRRRWLRLVVAALTPIAALTLPSGTAQGDPNVLVYPGMEIIQGTNVCTLGYVDPQARDWEAISLAPDVQVNNVLPGGRPLVSDPGIVPTPGLAVCHFGVVTSESCGTIQAVYNGWFTMANGVVSQKGDSGGPVYVLTPDGRAAIIGMFNSTWGQYPAAVSWQVASKQASEDVISAASGSIPTPVPEPWSAPAP
jgi:hypothetical protein